MEAIYREMQKLGVTSGTTTEFTLRDTSGPGSATGTGSRQASVTELDNEPKTAANYRSDVALNRVELLPTDLGIYLTPNSRLQVQISALQGNNLRQVVYTFCQVHYKLQPCV